VRIPRRRRRRATKRPQAATAPTTDPKLETIVELTSFKARLPGSDAERRAANAMAARIESLGRRAHFEPIHVHPQMPLVWAAHCFIAFAGSLVAVEVPAAGFAAILVAATSLYLDMNSRAYLLRRLFFRRTSQNVVSPGVNPTAPARVILTAHIDSGRAGLVFGERQVRWANTLNEFLPFPHTRLLFWSVASLLPMIGARMAGIDSNAVAAMQLLPTLILLVAMFLLVDWQLSSPAPGANDNASGVAVALGVAAEIESDPASDLDVWILLTGGGECGMQGMRSFARSRRGELDLASTVVIALDSVGAGDVRWIASEGLTISFPADPRLAELCEAVAEADRADESRYRAAPVRHGFASEALAARVAGMRSIAITGREPGAMLPAHHHTDADVPERIDEAALGCAQGFVLDLIRTLDRDTARRARREQKSTAS
jgi:hypothetical protein